MEEKKIVVNEKNVCGRFYYYPVNDQAMKVLSLTRVSTGRRKALTLNDLDTLKELGFVIEIKKPRVIYE